jgi:p-aminobenzoyl-glutamate transporter AbgT
MLVIGQFTFWGNMLPRYFPVHLRGTGESFAANIGGRLIGTSFAFLVFTVTDEKWQGLFPQSLHGTDGFPMRVAYTTAAIGFFVFALGWFIAGKLPDPQYGDHEDKKKEEPKTIAAIAAEDEEETTAPEDAPQ